MSELKRNREWNWHQQYLELKRNQENAIHIARLNTLDDLVVLLSINSPKKDTFNDTYEHCISNIKKVINNLREDIEMEFKE